mmetsp:Transcript_43321/g.92740  ORF Transcript_43321/g.92740 Transcript_43321/m.92740 type:complete len:113 (-) Transcript_43321:276-614(-)
MISPPKYGITLSTMAEMHTGAFSGWTPAPSATAVGSLSHLDGQTTLASSPVHLMSAPVVWQDRTCGLGSSTRAKEDFIAEGGREDEDDDENEVGAEDEDAGENGEFPKFPKF